MHVQINILILAVETYLRHEFCVIARNEVTKQSIGEKIASLRSQ